jgi:HSP20 family protein
MGELRCPRCRGRVREMKWSGGLRMMIGNCKLIAGVSTARERSSFEAAATRHPNLVNSILRSGQRFWAAIRALKAELAAFPVHLRRNGENLIVIADLPGLRREEISVELTDSMLVIEAEPNREDEPFFRRAGRRMISLPDGAAIQRARAQLKDGALTVWMPLRNPRKCRTLPLEESMDIEVRLEHPRQPRSNRRANHYPACSRRRLAIRNYQ